MAFVDVRGVFIVGVHHELMRPQEFGPDRATGRFVGSRQMRLDCSVLVSPEAGRPAGFRIAPWLIAGSGSVASFATLT